MGNHIDKRSKCIALIYFQGRHNCLRVWQEKYGDFYGFFEGPRPVIAVSDIELIKKICITDYNKYNRRKVPNKLTMQCM